MGKGRTCTIFSQKSVCVVCIRAIHRPFGRHHISIHHIHHAHPISMAPSPLRAQPEQSRSSPPTPRPPATRRLTDSARPTDAAAYATANQPKGMRTVSRPQPGAKSKPLFDWFTRKLGAGRRATYSDGSSRPKAAIHNVISRPESVSLRSYSMSYADSAERDRRREANNPYPSIPVPPRVESTYDSVSLSFLSRSRTPSIRSEASRPRLLCVEDREADEDASIRPFPPSSPSQTSRSVSILSPAPRSHLSRTTSFDSLGRQSRQDSTSTKPTTMSIESGPHPAHIAQVSAPPVGDPIAGPSRLNETPFTPDLIQAPKHTHPHPRDNPRPASPPRPNASTLTLASSTFATAPINHLPTARVRDLSIRPTSMATSPSVTFAEPHGDRPTSAYEYAPSAPSVYALSANGPSFRGWGRLDKDASVRALRRRGSSDSDQSRWSWKGQGGQGRLEEEGYGRDVTSEEGQFELARVAAMA